MLAPGRLRFVIVIAAAPVPAGCASHGTIGRLTASNGHPRLPASTSHSPGGDSVTRRMTLLPLAIIASLSMVIAACASTPQAPALTDPKEILTQAVVSLNGVKTAELTGSFSGTIAAAQLGTFDLSTITMSGQIDIPNKKAKFNLDAPTLLGTKVDALLLDQVAYVKVAGPFAALANLQADKYTKAIVPQSSDNPTDVATTVANLKAGLDKLPTPP